MKKFLLRCVASVLYLVFLFALLTSIMFAVFLFMGSATFEEVGMILIASLSVACLTGVGVYLFRRHVERGDYTLPAFLWFPW